MRVDQDTFLVDLDEITGWKKSWPRRRRLEARCSFVGNLWKKKHCHGLQALKEIIFQIIYVYFQSNICTYLWLSGGGPKGVVSDKEMSHSGIEFQREYKREREG